MKSTHIRFSPRWRPHAAGQSRNASGVFAWRALAVFALLSGTAWAQTDNFNDGNDTGWTRYSPLAPFGAAATYTFPNGAYRIRCPVSPDPGLLGPARAGSLRSNNSYSRFSVAVDLVAWDADVDQVSGILTCVSDVGLGTTDGYALDYQHTVGNLQIILVTDEAPLATLVEKKASLTPGACYRFLFTGAGGDLLGQVFLTNNLTVPLASASTFDTTYAEGIVGLFGFNVPGTGGFDATFDNFEAKEPGTLRAVVTSATPRPEDLPAGPIEIITVEILNRETAADSATVRLEVDGVEVTAAAELGWNSVTVTYSPASPLSATVRHQAKLSYSDGQGVQTAAWEFGPPAAPATKLLAAARVNSPYAEDTSAVWDGPAKTFTLPLPTAARFYRLQSDVQRRITAIQVKGQQLVLTHN
jgi:hypothetical protein